MKKLVKVIQDHLGKTLSKYLEGALGEALEGTDGPLETGKALEETKEVLVVLSDQFSLEMEDHHLQAKLLLVNQMPKLWQRNLIK